MPELINSNNKSEKADFLDLLLSSASDYIFQLDAQGYIRYTNRVMEGIEREDVIGTHWHHYFPASQRALFERNFNRTFLTGEVLECEFTDSDETNGISYWLRFHPFIQDGRTVGVLISGRDNTLRKAVLQLESRQRQVFDFFAEAPALICMLKGKDFVIQMANQEYKHLLGDRDIIGKPLLEALPAFDEKLYQALRTVYETKHPFIGKDFEVIADWKRDEKIEKKYFTFLLKPVLDVRGDIDGVWVLALNVTESKRLESSAQLNNRLHSLGTLAAGIGHEINNPLAYSILNLDIIKMEMEAIVESKDLTALKDLSKRVEVAQEGLKRITTIVKSLKDFGRPSDMEELEFLDLQECIQKAMNIVRHQFKGKSRVAMDLEDQIFVRGNETKLIQVFVNLFINTAQAMTENVCKENLLKIKTTSTSKDIVIKIQDTGVGIAAEDLGKVFDPFFTTKDPGVGTGLGLPISHGIVTTMGGDMSLMSKPGKGTTVTLRFPQAVKV